MEDGLHLEGLEALLRDKERKPEMPADMIGIVSPDGLQCIMKRNKKWSRMDAFAKGLVRPRMGLMVTRISTQLPRWTGSTDVDTNHALGTR